MISNHLKKRERDSWEYYSSLFFLHTNADHLGHDKYHSFKATCMQLVHRQINLGLWQEENEGNKALRPQHLQGRIRTQKTSLTVHCSQTSCLSGDLALKKLVCHRGKAGGISCSFSTLPFTTSGRLGITFLTLKV